LLRLRLFRSGLSSKKDNGLRDKIDPNRIDLRGLRVKTEARIVAATGAKGVAVVAIEVAVVRVPIEEIAVQGTIVGVKAVDVLVAEAGLSKVPRRSSLRS